MPDPTFYEFEYYKQKFQNKEKSAENSNPPQQPTVQPIPQVTYVYHLSMPMPHPMYGSNSLEIHHQMTRMAAVNRYMQNPTGFNPIDFYNRVDDARRRGSLGL